MVVLRLYPIVPANARAAVRDTTLLVGGGPDGKSPVFVKAGQAVNYQVYTMHRRKDLYGEDALEFKPER
jgi:cytochrome P450